MPRKVRVIVFCILFFSGAFSIPVLILDFGDWLSAIVAAAVGALIGVFAAPSIEPKAFKRAWAYEMGAGGLAGALLGLLVGSRETLINSALSD